MSLSERVRRLRERSLKAAPSLSGERARLLTEFYREHAGGDEPPLTRARAFAWLMERRSLPVLDGELIVGEKGHAPGAAPTFPELCCHSLEDLDILDARPLTSYRVDAELRQLYRDEVIGFWRGRSMREKIFEQMSDEWKACYEAGLFTEFMEQRSPGHTVLDGKIYSRGMKDFRHEIQERLAGESRPARRAQLEAMDIAAGAIIRLGERYAERLAGLAAACEDPARRAELERMAEVCRRVPAEAPRDFHEALQYYWFVHLGVTSELNPWDAFNPGRLDQHLQPFYERGLAEGTLTRESARELLHCLWIKFNNQPAPPKVGVTAQESGTYTDFVNISLGGLTREGEDAVSETSFLILDVIEEMRLLQPGSSIQVSEKNPDAFIERAARIQRTGFGQPSVFNTDLIVREMLRQGKSEGDAREGGASGCVETGAFGKENYNLTGYFNLPKVLEIALNNGIDPRSGRRLGPATGDPREFERYEQLYASFETQLRHFLEIKLAGNDIIEELYAREMPAPFLSLLIDDCIATGRDYHDGGARYDTSYVQGVGLGSITDSLAALHELVFEHEKVGMDELLDVLAADFEGREDLRQVLVNKAPKYGNDVDAADSRMLEVFESYFAAIDGRPNFRGGSYHINLLPTTVHVYFGSVTGALPDGRRAGAPLSEGVSPVQGADRRGPTAVLRSVAKMDHSRTGGTLLNQKFTPDLLAGDAGLARLAQLVRGYFELGGHHVQFNVVGAETLREAQREPEAHRDLIVRVAGYSDYFRDIGRELQDEIIARTEHHGD